MNKHIANEIMPRELQAQLVTASHGAVGPVQSADMEELVNFGFELDDIVEISGRSVSLFSRIDKGQSITSFEFESIMRMTRFKDHALRVFGDSKKAAMWMRRECRALGNAVPIHLLHSEAGAQIVEEQLFRIEHGIQI